MPKGGFRSGTVVGSDEVGAGKNGVPSQKQLDVVGREIANPATTGRLYEIGVVLNPYGTPMMRASQQVKDSVEWDTGQLDRIKQAGNASLLHNHPSGTSLSRDDAMFAVSNNLASIHAYGTLDTDTSRTATRYSLFRPTTGWQLTRADYAYNKARDEVTDSNWAKIRSAEGDPERTKSAIETANVTHSSQVMRRFAQVYNDGDDSGPGILHGDLGPADELRYEEGTW